MQQFHRFGRQNMTPVRAICSCYATTRNQFFLVSLEECCNSSPVYDGGVSSTSVSPRVTQATPEAENVCANVAVMLPFVISVSCDGQAQTLACANSSSHRCYHYTTLQDVPQRRVWVGVRYGCPGKNKFARCEVLFNTGSEKFCQAD